jgi:UDP-glucose 4-epimerase
MSYDGRRVLITGGAGFIGSFLAERLVDAGADVIVLDNYYRGRRENLAGCLPSIRLIEGDIRDAHQVASVMEGIDTVFHLAAQSQVRTALAEPRYCFETNVSGTFNVLEAARTAGVRRLLFASSREVYGEAAAIPVSEDAPLNAKNGYGLSKVAGELYCGQYRDHFDVSVVRLGNVYGPRDFGRVIPIFAQAALENHPLTLLGGKQICDFVWVGTVVEQLLRMGDGPARGPLNIASGIPVTLVHLAERIISLSQSSSALVYAPEIAAEVAHFVADVSRAREQLGLEIPRDPLHGLTAVIEHLSTELALSKK